MTASIAAFGSPSVVVRIKDAPVSQLRNSRRFRSVYSCRSSRYLGGGLRRSSATREALGKRHCTISITCKAKDLTEEEFDAAVLRSELPVLVDFWAEWCGPCKLVAPAIDWAAQDYAGKIEFYKIDTEKSPGLVERYKPYGLPTLLMFKNGEVVPGSRKEGAITKAKLKAYLDDMLHSVAA